MDNVLRIKSLNSKQQNIIQGPTRKRKKFTWDKKLGRSYKLEERNLIGQASVGRYLGRRGESASVQNYTPFISIVGMYVSKLCAYCLGV